MTITIHVPAIPIAQPRHRVGVINGKARAFEAKKSHAIHDYKASVRHAASEVYDGPPLTGPLAILVTFVLPRPRQMVWKSKPMPRVRHTKKPDADNLYKGTVDALNGLLFVDDSQLCRVWINKLIAAGDEQPHVVVKLIQEDLG